jgi:hypothetical protein
LCYKPICWRSKDSTLIIHIAHGLWDIFGMLIDEFLSPFLVVTFKDSSGEFCTVLLVESPNATMCIITDEEPTHLRRPRQNLALKRDRFWLTKVVYERMPGQCTIV